MWIWSQDSGELWRQGQLQAKGYAGADVDNIDDADDDKNNPAVQSLKRRGPLPVGFYTIEWLGDTKSHGPYVLRLAPDAKNEMYGRDGFLIHGDSKKHPGQASLGCIVVSRAARVAVWESGDRRLRVVASYADMV